LLKKGCSANHDNGDDDLTTLSVLRPCIINDETNSGCGAVG
jgi:hypothetical protein